ncbi:class I SAM-dependent methyltransferase [Streptosporangium sp. NPDC000396]|uniref:class I SAM-dependent methyltransferase n=1 Tax=Streptosporangium sp. NPDC000396 TaxID=3366185 RepID=UPI0036938389
MSVSTTHSTVVELIDSFAGATPDRLDAEFQRLAGALWNDGDLTDLALSAVPALVARLDQVDDDRKGYLAILLGLLAEAEYPAADGEVSAAVRQGLDRYLDLVSRSVKGQPLSLALFYLLAHFPEDRERVLSAASALDIDSDDLGRLDRALQRLDPDNPVLGRVFPSPSVWTLDDTEREFDQAWTKTLTPAQIAHNWENDTRTVLGHAGGKAYWAVCNGTPEAAGSPSVPARDIVRTAPSGPAVDIFTRHADAFRCTNCRSRLDFQQSGVRCTGCASTYPVANGVLNLFASVRDDEDDFLLKLSEIPTMGLFYEAVARPAFLRVSGSNWGGLVTRSDEDAYIAEHVRPVDGPVLDLAAGAGSWTATLAKAVGAERVIALDVNPAMLTVLRGRLPEVPSVLASASNLPFGDATLGAVLCWNALQAFPDDAPAAIAEVGRCLRPGGTFTIMTFRMSSDRVARYFQAAHRLPQHAEGLRLFELDELKGWLAKAGLTVREESGPGTFVFITAERTG